MDNRVFLDTNYFIDAIHRKSEKNILEALIGYAAYVSPISVPIYCYLFKIEVPNDNLSIQIGKFRFVDLTREILEKAVSGPTRDLEDNLQLHSAAEAECNYFLTNDEKLLKMKFFGKTKIASKLGDNYS
ncbi:MAG: hypothetical protein US60_C0014G0005 [Microgenomates group bacterium GW2011_GWC1_37_8]|uniref:PIN domain-containing protein n=1 Tax=Candidatus Woesebacteria bacterium GW2011_GWB1_38_8 TaxID=1618570 RepID=A0A0G0KXN2_9BACT|nr:MAG: hypothetical protein US60_C0014G0005 [Microgenomates group bacterium GW2011_GWC1_37_8]KKQ84398.1 MAG: hypothetical protein UT08_C0018G0004 [Candidatus Woesebacteria bacterium GW2011_GWB1_38_8]